MSEAADVSEPKLGEEISDEQHAKFHWGAPISKERQTELQALAYRQREWAAQPEGTRGDSVFQYVQLTGADVFWLAAQSGAGKYGEVPNLHLEGAWLLRAHLEGAVLLQAHLDMADIRTAHLERATLAEAHLEGADLDESHLEEARLVRAHLEDASLSDIHLENANLTLARLARANLGLARLERADLSGANLVGADLSGANLVGADLGLTHLGWANLTGATFDKTSRLKGAIFTEASLDQVTFDNVNLTVVDWSLVPMLGDEVTARRSKDDSPFEHEKDAKKTTRTRLEEFKAAVRANRVLAVTLRSQGLSEDADRFAYRAQVLQRQVLRRQGKFGPWLFSGLLWLVSGYGYRLWRILVTYALALLGFAAVYWVAGMLPGGHHLAWYEALLTSLTNIHGRVFTGTFGLDTAQAWAAGVQAVMGLVIEGVFVAMLVQRYFAR
jgi:uncharacterized protein YjbI with pentapeptide repeats